MWRLINRRRCLLRISCLLLDHLIVLVLLLHRLYKLPLLLDLALRKLVLRRLSMLHLLLLGLRQELVLRRLSKLLGLLGLWSLLLELPLLLHRLDSLVTLCIETWIHRRFRIFKLLSSL